MLHCPEIMPKCEWEGINCPPSLYENCLTRLKATSLWERRLLIEQEPRAVWTSKKGRKRTDLRMQLSELTKEVCPLWQKLSHSLKWSDFTDEQLAAVGASRIPLTRSRNLVFNPAGEA